MSLEYLGVAAELLEVRRGAIGLGPLGQLALVWHCHADQEILVAVAVHPHLLHKWAVLEGVL